MTDFEEWSNDKEQEGFNQGYSEGIKERKELEEDLGNALAFLFRADVNCTLVGMYKKLGIKPGECECMSCRTRIFLKEMKKKGRFNSGRSVQR